MGESGLDETLLAASLTDPIPEIVPVEVKSGINTKAKSLSVFRGKFQARHSVLLTAAPMKLLGSGRVHLPLYLAAGFPAVLGE